MIPPSPFSDAELERLLSHFKVIAALVGEIESEKARAILDVYRDENRI